MKPRYIVIGLILFAVLLFAAANWGLVMQISTLNLILGTVTAPLGVVLLCALGGVVLVYQMLLLRVETQLLLDGRRAAKEVDQLRKVAEAAESSRLEGLRKEVAEGFTLTQDKMAQAASAGLETLRKEIAEGLTRNEERLAAMQRELRPQARPDSPVERPVEPPSATERGATSVSSSIKKVLDKFKSEAGG